MRSRSNPPPSLLVALNEEIVALTSNIVDSTAIVSGQTRDFAQGSGSAWLIDPAHLITNNHVVENLVEPIWVRFPDRKEVPASVVGQDRLTDLAVLRTQPHGNRPLPLRQHPPRLGELCFAFGSPLGQFPESVSQGIVSGLKRSLPAAEGRAIFDVIQTDCSINPGNSGGPLVGIDGHVIGVNTAIRKDATGIGFAVPAETVADIVPELLTYGNIERATLGVSVASRRLDDDPYGVPRLVVVAARDNAAGAFQRGDLLLRIAGYGVQSIPDLTRILRRNMIGARIPVTVWRSGAESTVDCVPTRLETSSDR